MERGCFKKLIFMSMALIITVNAEQAKKKEPNHGIKTEVPAVTKTKTELPFKHLKFKVVNGHQVASSTKKGAVVREDFIGKKEKAEKQLQTDHQKLIEANKEFTAKASTLSDTAKEAEEKKIAKMDRDLKLKAQELKEELEADMYKKTEELGIEFENVVRTYGKENKLDLIIDESSGRIIYVADNLKCSDDIIKLMDQNFDKKDTKLLTDKTLS